MPEQNDMPRPPENRAGVYNILAILCGTWFLLTGWIWTYFANLLIAYPVGIAGLFLWKKARKINPGDRKNQAALALHVFGLASSLVSFFLYK